MLPVPPGLDLCVSLMEYDDVAASIIRRLKYSNHRDALPRLAEALAVRLGPVSFDQLTWVPATNPHRRRRGFDQGELLARRLGRPERLLRRLDDHPQTGRSRAERLEGPSFEVVAPVAGVVLVVDDVRTTGSSLAAAAATLRAAGATSVLGATLAARAVAKG